MLQIDNIILSRDIIERKFHCNLTFCKGICCVEGDAGAPLEKYEIRQIEKSIESVKKFMKKEGIAVLNKKGIYIEAEKELLTPLINNRDCIYAFREDGIVKCSFEAAFYNNNTSFLKPISCHLYPIRLTNYSSFTALNYHKWHICKDALKTGEKEGVLLYKFLKDPLIRKFGLKWYEKLVYAVKNYKPED